MVFHCRSGHAQRCTLSLKQFWHYLQSDQESVTSANIHIGTPKEFISVKDGSGEFLYNFVVCFNETGKFQNISVVKTAGDENKFTQTKMQFTRPCMIIFFSTFLARTSWMFACVEQDQLVKWFHWICTLWRQRSLIIVQGAWNLFIQYM